MAGGNYLPGIAPDEQPFFPLTLELHDVENILVGVRGGRGESLRLTLDCKPAHGEGEITTSGAQLRIRSGQIDSQGNKVDPRFEDGKSVIAVEIGERVLNVP